MVIPPTQHSSLPWWSFTAFTCGPLHSFSSAKNFRNCKSYFICRQLDQGIVLKDVLYTIIQLPTPWYTECKINSKFKKFKLKNSGQEHYETVHLGNSYDSLSFESNMKIEVSGLYFLSLDEMIKINSLILPNLRCFFHKILPLWVIYSWKGRLPAHSDQWRAVCGTVGTARIIRNLWCACSFLQKSIPDYNRVNVL